MKRNVLLILGLATVLVACSKKYYPEMYQKAGEEVLVVVKTEKDTVLHTPVLPADTLITTDTINVTQKAEQVVDAIVEKATIRETSDTYTSGGVAVQQQYHVVVGSFQSEVNAQNLQITLQKQGFNAMVAVNQNGLFRVFMYSADTEVEICKAMAKARVTYPDAWMLKIAK